MKNVKTFSNPLSVIDFEEARKLKEAAQKEAASLTRYILEKTGNCPGMARFIKESGYERELAQSKFEIAFATRRLNLQADKSRRK